jgi:hypothetical protein
MTLFKATGAAQRPKRPIIRLPMVRAAHHLNAFPYRNPRNGLGEMGDMGDWTDVLTGDPTAADMGILTLPDTSAVDTSLPTDNTILGPSDAWAQGTATPPPDVNAVDTTITDRTDAWAQGIGTPDQTGTSVVPYTDPNALTTDNSILGASDAWARGLAKPPSAVVTHTPAASSNWENIIGGVAAVAAGVASYKKNQLPGGGAVYTRYDPLTGRPMNAGGTFTFGPKSNNQAGGGIAASLTGMFSNPIALAAIGLGAVLLLTGKRKAK